MIQAIKYANIIATVISVVLDKYLGKLFVISGLWKALFPSVMWFKFGFGHTCKTSVSLTVGVGGASSSPSIPVFCEVPQGSVLGLFLFLIDVLVVAAVTDVS